MPDIHLGGMVSGMDTQSIIDEILQIRVRDITKLEEKNISLQADVAAWTDVGGSISNLTDSLYALRDFDTWSKQTATSSDLAKLTATATGSAVAATYDLSVSQVAKAHSVATDSVADLGLSSSTDVLVGTVPGLSAGDEFIIQGETITIEAGDTMVSLATKINDASAVMAADDKVTARVLADRLVITRDTTGSSEISVSDSVGTALVDLGVLQSVTAKPQAASGNTLWMEMSGNASPSVLDSSSYGNDGTEVDGAVWTPSGQFDGAIALDGTNDAITIDQSPENDGFGAFTWSVWVNTTTKSKAVMSYGDRADGAGIAIEIRPTGVIQAFLDDGSSTAVTTGSTDISDGAWHLVTITNDGTDFKLYIDGNTTPEDTDDSSGLGFITTNDNDKIDVGRQWDNGSYADYFNGSIDEVMIYNRELSAAEVNALYSSTTTSSYKNELVAAQDAVFTVNGGEVTRSSNKDLTDVISGVSLNLLQATTSDITLTVAQDTDTPKAAINDFITNYNAAVSKLESYVRINLDDPRNPVVGELQGDTLVGSLLYNMRRLVTQSKSPYMDATNASYTYDGKTGIMESLEDIGVWTTGKENVISLNDETKMDYLLENYYDEVEQLFRGIGGAEGFEHGVAEDLYDFSYSASTSLTGQIDVRKNAIETESGRYQDKIDKMYDDLDDYEQDLWNQFGAMEEAMSRMQSESSWLVSQMNTKQA